MLPIPDIAPAELANAIEALYDVRVHALPTSLPPGFHSRAWRVVTMSHGTWVAKLSSPMSDPIAKLEQQIRLANYLNQNGIRAPQNRPLRDGTYVTTLTVEHQGYPLQLLKAEELGRIALERASRATFESIGELVACLHNILDHYPERDTIRADRHKSANEWGARKNGLWPVVVDLPDVSLLSDAECAWLRRVDQQAVACIQTQFVEPATLALALLHGDLNFEHIQLLNDGTAYMFDFGDLCWGPIAHELAVFFLNLFCESDLSFSDWELLRQHILRGYQAKRHLSHRDQEMIDVFIVNRVIARAEYSIELAQDVQLAIDWTSMKRTYTLAEYLVNQAAGG